MSIEKEWTVGPELRSGRFGGPTIRSGGSTIAVVFSGSGLTNARATLFAAAPMMLRALKRCVEDREEDCLDRGWDSVEDFKEFKATCNDNDSYRLAVAAIAEAERELS